jgi:hypothetical protein
MIKETFKNVILLQLNYKLKYRKRLKKLLRNARKNYETT